MIIKLTSYEGEIAVTESMCLNPDCVCMDLFLTFHQMQKGDITDPLFKITVDLRSWNVTEKEIYKEDINVEEMTNEFMSNLDNKTKTEMKDRVLIAKVEEEPIDWLDNMDLYNTPLIGYSEAFGLKTRSKCIYKYDGLDYFVEDYYCVNPKCKCNDCVLIFYTRISENEQFFEKFSVRLKLNKGKYKIEDADDISNDEIANIVSAFLENLGGIFLLRKRYRKMKKFGRMRIKRKKKNNKRVKAKVKVGRNDPCPCGSGKKYKKCCGR